MTDFKKLIGEGVEKQVLTPEQAKQLAAIAEKSEQAEDGSGEVATRAEAKSAGPKDDSEAFQFITNLSDVFIAAGLFLFFSTLSGVVNHLLGGGFSEEAGAGSALSIVILIAVNWMLAEYVSGRRKLTLPSIVILGFCISYVLELVLALMGWENIDQLPIVIAGTGAAVSILYFARFRLPFALFPIAALSIYLVVSLYVYARSGRTFYVFEYNQYDLSMLALIVFLGILTFIFAMYFDLKDPLRKSSNHDRAFWLHLVASPILVHVVSIKLIDSSGLSSLFLFIYLSCYTVLALVIDRRAGVLSAIFYLGASLTYISIKDDFTGISIFTSALLPTFIAACSALIVSLFWGSIRGWLLSILPGTAWKMRLPPAT